MEFKPCVVVPNFNHGETLFGLLERLQAYDIPCIVVDDGSSTEQRHLIHAACEKFSSVNLIRLDQNQGKGGAVMTGLNTAFDLGYSHAVQIDADGQHDLNELRSLIELSKKNPQDLVTGFPVFNESVPLGRFLARHITHFWVWVETLSFQIKDSMCGFRVYPLEKCVALVRSGRIGRRMDFDIEVLVRSYWAGLGIQQLPVRVTYSEDAKSNFKPFVDNVLISWAHTRLVLEMLPRIPELLIRKLKRQSSTHWSKRRESGSVLGMRILLGIYSFFGRRVLQLFLYPVICFYYLFSMKARSGSRTFLKQYREYCKKNVIVPQRVSVFKHLFSFAAMILDKFAAWKGDIRINDKLFPLHDHFLQLAKEKTGLVFVTAHFGNMEVIRALSRTYPELKVNVLVYTEHAKKFNNVLKSLDLGVGLNLISVKEFGIDTAILLKEKIENGEWIFVMGDRMAIGSPDKGLQLDFLGRKANFPQGPFVLGELMDSPLYSIFCFRDRDGFYVKAAKLAERNVEGSKLRRERQEVNARRFVEELQKVVLLAPLQWFNFYDFWEKK